MPKPNEGNRLFCRNFRNPSLEAKDGYSKVSMKVEKVHTNALGFTHGGAIFSLADYAFAHACNFGDNVAVAVQVSINFLKPSAEGDLLTAEATQSFRWQNHGIVPSYST